MRVLVVEDNVTLAKSIARVLKQENFSVDILADGIEAEEFCLMNHGDLDLIILDVQLPGMNGFLCDLLWSE